MWISWFEHGFILQWLQTAMHKVLMQELEIITQFWLSPEISTLDPIISYTLSGEFWVTIWACFQKVYCSLLFVPAKPFIPADSFPSIYQVAEGKSLLATCITTGNPRPEVSWYYFQPVPGSQLGVKGKYLILNPFKTNGIFHNAKNNKVRMVYCIYWGVIGYNWKRNSFYEA